ncbi:hypothetical protein [Paenibacillus amylolyticus]|uniref:hypothetical protein n=1 Tax=Paenibacillus amylolyticus TaxID=1451 RepID=UPI0039AF7B9D
MLKSVVNIILIASIIVFLFFLFIIFFNPPTDILEVGKLKVRTSISAGIMAVAAFTRTRIKRNKF